MIILFYFLLYIIDKRIGKKDVLWLNKKGKKYFEREMEFERLELEGKDPMGEEFL